MSNEAVAVLAFLENRCSGLRDFGRTNTVSISGCLKRLHIVLGNLLRLPKAVAYRFHKRLHNRVGN